MAINEHAGQPAEPSMLVDVDRLVRSYFEIRPDPSDPAQRVAFGTSGHRGSALNGAFNEAHIAATTEAICRYRERQGTDGPLFIGRDTHALSGPAMETALGVLAAHGVEIRVDAADGYTPTPVISHAILVHNRGSPRAPGRRDRRHAVAQPARGWRLQVQPAERRPGRHRRHDPDPGRGEPAPRGRPRRRPAHPARAGAAPARPPTTTSTATSATSTRSSTWTPSGAPGCGSASTRSAARASRTGRPSRERYGLDLTVTNDVVDPQFGFMTCDWDGRIRMDPSSPYAMARLVELRDRFDVAFANDTDADRHGIVTPGAGLLNPNHFLSVVGRAPVRRIGRDWGADVAVGKTLVSSSAMIDRVAADLGRRLLEVPVGFKWFVPGLVDGSLGFGGEESAGASFLRRDGTAWTTDKDGIIACLLAAEMTARTRARPGRGVRRADRAVRRPGLSADRRRRDARPEGGPRAAVGLARSPPPSSPATR